MIFQLRKYLTIIYVFFRSQITGWKKAENIFLPVNLSIGFNVVRWILNGRYEEGEINIIKNRLEKTDRVFEIGTGLGFISSFCAKKNGNENVFTFEANTTNIPICKSVFKKNKVNPSLINALLSDENGTYKFSVNKSNRLGSSALVDTGLFVEIPKYKLNDKIKEIAPDFLIMDIEGAEYDIFSIIDFQTIRKVQFELHPSVLGPQKCDKIFEILSNNGFKKDVEVSSEVNFYFFR